MLQKLLSKTLAGIVLFCVAAAGAFVFSQSLQHRSAKPIARRAAASTVTDPDVVLIFVDTVRYDDFGHDAYLRSFADSSIVFDNAWSTAPWTIPSHFSVLTGADPWRTEYDLASQQFHYAKTPLSEYFRKKGYETGAVFANPLLTPVTGFTSGYDYFEYSQSAAACKSGLAFLLTHVYSYAQREPPLCGMMPATVVASKAINFIERTKRPFFLALNFMDAHDPYPVAPSCRDRQFTPYTAADRLALSAAITQGTPLHEPTAARIHAQYRAAIRCMDHSIDRLLSTLSTPDRQKRTIVAIVSDHGEQFGEHSLVGHGNSLYAQLLHVPVVLRVPGERPRHVSAPVSTSELFRFLVTGSYGRLDLRGTEKGQSVVAAMFPQLSAFSIVDGSYHLVRTADGKEELYDYIHDPSETRVLTNVNAIDASRSKLVRELASRKQTAAPFHSLGYLN